MKKIIIILIGLFSLWLIKPVYSSELFPNFPMTFYGEAKNNNDPSAVGSKILVSANGETVGEVNIVTEGIYGTTSPIGPNLSVREFNGNELIFYYLLTEDSIIDSNTPKLIKNIEFSSGLTTELNLNFISSKPSRPSGGGGGGGGSSVIYCSSLTYSDWDVCSGNIQQRNVVTKYPQSCQLTVEQQISLTRDCLDVIVKGEESDEFDPNNSSETPNENKVEESNEFINLINKIKGEAVIIISEKPFNQDQSNQINIKNIEDKFGKIINLGNNADGNTKDLIRDFIAYGTPSTKILGAGERAGVVNSYFQAYGRTIVTQEEWLDLLKIANGRWPGERSAAAEERAKIEFKKIYAREANFDNNIEENAVMVIAYGLLPSQRNLDSEKAAIKAFMWVYNRVPISALDWNIVRSIAYSGAKRS